MAKYKCYVCGGTTGKLKICCGRPVERVFEVEPKRRLRKRDKSKE